MSHYHIWRIPNTTWTPLHDWDYTPIATPTPPPAAPQPAPSCPGQGLGWCDCPPDPDHNDAPCPPTQPRPQRCPMPAHPTPPNAPAPSDNLTRWTTDPDWPEKPRIFPNPLPPHIHHTLTDLSRQTPLILITINLTTDTQTTTPL